MYVTRGVLVPWEESGFKPRQEWQQGPDFAGAVESALRAQDLSVSDSGVLSRLTGVPLFRVRRIL
jgi:hypothetical protein